MQYARILIEVKIDQQLLEFVQFWNEKGELTKLFVMCEWKHMQCVHCKSFGHASEKYRVKKIKQVWRPKVKEAVPVEANVIVATPTGAKKDVQWDIDPEGFQRALRPIRVRSSLSPPTKTQNTFQALLADAVDNHKAEVNELQQGGGEPPTLNG